MTTAEAPQLERIAIDLDAAPAFNRDVAALLNKHFADSDATLIAIMNDETETDTVRARALSLLIGDLLRAER